MHPVSAAAARNLQIAHVWRGQELASATEQVVPSGHAALDAQLPGGGWPVGHLVEILQARPGHHAWQLLLPSLAEATRAEKSPVVLVDAPFEPFGPGLQAQGLPLARLLRVRAVKPAARLWAAEQALRCAEVAAVVAWLPRASANELRRLHMAAQQHARLLFVFRPMAAAAEASPARVRLAVAGCETLEVRILKRRGPTLAEPIRLDAAPARLRALLQARRGPQPSQPLAHPHPSPRSRSHVLDRTAALA